MSQTRELPAKPVGVIASLSAGFDTVIQAWWILLLPILLDLFLWFGPHLSIGPVAERALESFNPLIGDDRALELIREAAAELNYFSIISVGPLGVPNLMTVRLPQSTPLGSPIVYAVSDELVWFLLFLSFSLGGLLVGGIYLGLIAQQVRDGTPNLRRLLYMLPRYWVSILALLVALLLVGAIMAAPVVLAAALLSTLGVWMATLVVWIGFMLFMWLIFHLFFTVHGMLLNEQPLLAATWNSLRLVAFSSFSTMGLLALVVGISAGLNLVWGLPPEDSWMLLIGVVGHAVISSGLVAATFVYYQDRYRYWKEVREYFAKATAKESLER